MPTLRGARKSRAQFTPDKGERGDGAVTSHNTPLTSPDQGGASRGTPGGAGQVGRAASSSSFFSPTGLKGGVNRRETNWFQPNVQVPHDDKGKFRRLNTVPSPLPTTYRSVLGLVHNNDIRPTSPVTTSTADTTTSGSSSREEGSGSGDDSKGGRGTGSGRGGRSDGAMLDVGGQGAKIMHTPERVQLSHRLPCVSPSWYEMWERGFDEEEWEGIRVEMEKNIKTEQETVRANIATLGVVVGVSDKKTKLIKTVQKAFSGKNAVEWVGKNRQHAVLQTTLQLLTLNSQTPHSIPARTDFSSAEEHQSALTIARLQLAGVYHHFDVRDRMLQESGLYRFRHDESSAALNARNGVMYGPVPHPCFVAETLLSMCLTKLLPPLRNSGAICDSDGEKMKGTKLQEAFLDRCKLVNDYGSQLQAVCLNEIAHCDPASGKKSMLSLTLAEAKCFFLNVYHALLIEVLAYERRRTFSVESLEDDCTLIGFPAISAAMHNYRYHICGYEYNVDEILHGVLLCKDARLLEAWPGHCDPRLLFACVNFESIISDGAVPKVFFPDTLEADLDALTRTACSTQIRIHPLSAEVEISPYISRHDHLFCDTPEQLLNFIARYTDHHLIDSLAMMPDVSSITIRDEDGTRQRVASAEVLRGGSRQSVTDASSFQELSQREGRGRRLTVLSDDEDEVVDAWVDCNAQGQISLTEHCPFLTKFRSAVSELDLSLHAHVVATLLVSYVSGIVQSIMVSECSDATTLRSSLSASMQASTNEDEVEDDVLRFALLRAVKDTLVDTLRKRSSDSAFLDRLLTYANHLISSSSCLFGSHLAFSAMPVDDGHDSDRVSSPTQKDLLAPLKRVCNLSSPPLSAEHATDILVESEEEEDPLVAISLDTLINAVFRHGCTAEARKELWPIMVWKAAVRITYAGRNQRWEDVGCEDGEWTLDSLKASYPTLAEQYKAWQPGQLARFGLLRTFFDQIDKDVSRAAEHYEERGEAYKQSLTSIMSSYLMLNFDQGYTQGMHVLGSAVMDVVEDEPSTFAVFANLMRVLSRNFKTDGADMSMERYIEFRCMLERMDPTLYQHLHDTGCTHDRTWASCFLAHFVFQFREVVQNHEAWLRLAERIWCGRYERFDDFIMLAIMTSERDTMLETVTDDAEFCEWVRSPHWKVKGSEESQIAEVDELVFKAEVLAWRYKGISCIPEK
mmetsp:Transcript_29132/g.74879  ORF Transcript_29132/g.74879 Transcript_29132/m.74879 type:complete len:1192 (-) Transcript_29132:220-3795(-)